MYATFESGIPAPTGRVYTDEIPGGQLSNLRSRPSLSASVTVSRRSRKPTRELTAFWDDSSR